MATEVGIKELLEAGVHFGHQTRRWNPKMRRFIHGERGGIYIIDLLKTQALLDQAQEFATELAHRGGTVLFVGTKKQARDAVKEVAESAGMPYVNHRWLGGLLTNFQTITQRIKRLHDLERYETEGQLALLPTRERMAAAGRPREAAGQPRRRQEHAAPAGRDVRHRPQDRGDRRARGPAPAHPDHRPGRHQLRPGRHRLRHPGQRRRDPLVHVITHAIGDVVAEGTTRFRAEEERARQEAEEQARREAEERARREAEEQAAPPGGRAGAPRGRGRRDDRRGRGRPRRRRGRGRAGPRGARARAAVARRRGAARARRPRPPRADAGPEAGGPGEPAPPALDPTPDPASPPASEVGAEAQPQPAEAEAQPSAAEAPEAVPTPRRPGRARHRERPPRNETHEPPPRSPPRTSRTCASGPARA